MNAIALQIPGCEKDEFIFAADQPEYIPLPALNITIGNVEGILTRWRPTDDERQALASGADIWLEVMTGGAPLQPVRVSVQCPITPEAQG